MSITLNGKDKGNELARVAEVLQGACGIAIDAIHSLDTSKGRFGEGNRAFSLEDAIRELGPSFQTDGQLQAGVVFDVPGTDLYEVLIGNRRFAVCHFFRMPFLARKLGYVPTLAEKIKIRLTENIKREDMSFFDIAADVNSYIAATGCKQGEAAALLGLDESLVSKAITVAENLAPELRPHVESGKVGRTISYLIATLPDIPTQVYLGKLVMEKGLTRDNVVKRIKVLKGGKEKKAKALKHADGPACVVLPTNWPGEKIVEWLAARLGAAKDWLRKGVPPEKWGTL
jgi:ParB/RepB/Spo0J family partition protein